MDKINLALDWIPNINHVGFFVAQEKGFFRNHGVEVTITDPSFDDYGMTPAKKVELGIADFALCPAESIINNQRKKRIFNLVAVGALLQSDSNSSETNENASVNPVGPFEGNLYNPMMVADEANIRNREDEYKRFLAASREGFAFCKENPQEASEILKAYLPGKVDRLDLIDSLKAALPSFGIGDSWGIISRERVVRFLSWLNKKGLEFSRIKPRDLYTNSLLRD